MLAEGERALADGQRYQAVELFSGALALRPRSMVAYYRRGVAYADERLYDKAIRDLREAARLSPTAPQPLEALGKLHDDQGNPAQAAEWYRQAADRSSNADAGLLYALALALYRSGAPAEAAEPLRLALARQETAEAHYLLALVARDTQAAERALASLQHAVRLAPTMIAAREELADLYRALGQRDNELRELSALAALDDQVERRVAVALAEARAGRATAALDSLEAAAVPGSPDSRVLLATGRVLLGEAERTHDPRTVARALSALEAALGGTARRSEGLALYGRALYLSGDAHGAVRILQEALATSPIDPEAFAFLADAAERAGAPLVARAALADLDAIQGDTAAADVRGVRARRMGVLSLDGGEPRAAARYLTQAVGSTTPDAATLGLLARARWQSGDPEGARTALGQALALGTPDADLQRLARTIR
jgi:tetratricopeptide (TPR) repeat protein